MAVNVSLARIDGDRLVKLVVEVLRDTGLEPCYLDIEVTESQVMKDTKRARQVMENIRALGVRIAMDDFGTGYSSIAYLQMFRFDVLKMDRSLITSIDSDHVQRALVRAIIDMAAPCPVRLSPRAWRRPSRRVYCSPRVATRSRDSCSVVRCRRPISNHSLRAVCLPSVWCRGDVQTRATRRYRCCWAICMATPGKPLSPPCCPDAFHLPPSRGLTAVRRARLDSPDPA